jgi:regulator of replication initiation timing
MDKKFETYTYSELLTEFITVIEKTETLKKDLILEMAKRKESEGIERKKISTVIIEDLKNQVSGSYVRNVLSEMGFTDQKKTSNVIKKEIEANMEKEKPQEILIGANGQTLVPEQPVRQIEPQPDDENNDITSMIQRDNEEIIDQRPAEQKEHDYSEAEEELDKITMIRDLKIENNNLTQEIRDFDKTKQQLETLLQEKTDLMRENTKLRARITELEAENGKLKQEIKALRNTPASTPAAQADPNTRFSKVSHEDYNKNKYYKMVGKGK